MIDYLNNNLITINDNPKRSVKLNVPKDPKKVYDVKDVIEEVMDKNTFFEIQQLYAQNAVIGLARLNSLTVGIVANQPKVLAGCLDINYLFKVAI